MTRFAQSMQVCIGGGHWSADCDAIWVITIFATIILVAVAAVVLRRSIQDYLHRRSINKWFAKQAVAQTKSDG